MKLLVTAILSLSTVVFAEEIPMFSYITVDADAVQNTKALGSDVRVINQKNNVALIHLPTFKAFGVGSMMHKDFLRCPGYIRHETEAEAVQYMNAAKENKSAKKVFVDYTINQQETVEKYISQVASTNIAQTIGKLSSFQNRFYQAETGVQSATWIKDTWTNLSKHRTDVKVEFFKHSKWAQPSVIATIEGSSNASEIVVIGGHQDSINGYGGATKRAPGADDNASGISTITEVFRIAMENEFRPTKTVKFMAYAAEEVGLLGSKEIAAQFKQQGKNVVGVMQLDMTNFKGSQKDIWFMSDYTNAAQNEFLAALIDKYVKSSWGYSRCGYGCSDHASWHLNGYPASIPFEAKMEEMNHKIHTENDTLTNSDSSASHAAKFAKIATAFMVELAKE